jgi:hypothetical protein
MSPREMLAKIEGSGCRLSLRPGGLNIKGKGEQTPPELKTLILEHREELIEFLESEARAVEAHEASLAAGRVTTFDPRLRDYVHPSIRHL